MEKIWFPIISVLMLFISGCSKNPLGSPGMLSFYSGTTSNLSPIVKKVGWTRAYEGYIYIKSIDVSTNGEKWINVFNGPAEVGVTQAGTIKIGSTIDLPEDEYHGIRITIEPKVKIVYSGSEVLLEKLPATIVLEGGSVVATGISNPSDTISITSANGHLVPFTIQRGKETFIIFSMKFDVTNTSPITDWQLYISVWASKYLS
jgi:hypothetical protein